MSLSTTQDADLSVDLPVQLPVTAVPPDCWMVVASVEVKAGQQLELRELQLHVAQIEALDSSTDPCAAVGLHAVSAEFVAGSLASLFICAAFAPDSRPDTQPYAEVLAAPADYTLAAAAVAPVSARRDPTVPLILTDAGVYSVVVLNNTTNRQLHLAVSGSLRLQEVL